MVSITLYHCGLLVFQNNLKSSNRPDTKFKVEPIPLSTVRPLIFKTIQMGDLRRRTPRSWRNRLIQSFAMRWRRWSGTLVSSKKLIYEVEDLIRYLYLWDPRWGGGDDQVLLWAPRSWCNRLIQSFAMRWRRFMIRYFFELQESLLWGGGDDQVHLWAPRSLVMRWRRWSGTFVSSKKLVHVQQIDTELRYEVEEMIRNICELQEASLWGGGDDQVHLWAPRSLCNRLIQSFAMRWRRWSGTFAVCV